MYLGLVEALQRRLLSSCLAVSGVGLQECGVDDIAGPDQAGIGFVDLLVPEGDEGERGGDQDNGARCENVMIAVDTVGHPHLRGVCCHAEGQ